MSEKTLTGRHVLAMFVCGFGIIIAVNVTLAVKAVKTFPGLEVANSYVASQNFDARRAAQEALGWEAGVSYDRGVLQLRVEDGDGTAIDAARFDAVIGRPTTQKNDIALSFDASGAAPVRLAPGRWRIDLHAGSGPDTFAQTLLLEVDP